MPLKLEMSAELKAAKTRLSVLNRDRILGSLPKDATTAVLEEVDYRERIAVVRYQTPREESQQKRIRLL